MADHLLLVEQGQRIAVSPNAAIDEDQVASFVRRLAHKGADAGEGGGEATIAWGADAIVDKPDHLPHGNGDGGGDTIALAIIDAVAKAVNAAVAGGRVVGKAAVSGHIDAPPVVANGVITPPLLLTA